MAAVVDAFAALPRAERRAALIALSDHLSPAEWRQVKALAAAKSFYCDLVANLPRELVLHVFSYLDLCTPFRLQAVSRRWCQLLQTPDLHTPLLRDWYGSHSHDTPNHATYEQCRAAAQVIHRLQSGNFLDLSATKPLAQLPPHHRNAESPTPERIALVDDFLVDVPYPFRHVRVTNLLTNQSWRAATQGRETISRVSASTQLISVWTLMRTACYVFDFTGRQRAKFRLPSFMDSIATCRERTVLCGGISNGAVELYLWNLDSNSGKTIRLDKSLLHPSSGDLSDHCLAISAIPNPRAQTLTLFTTRTCEARWCGHQVQDLSIRYCNFTFQGQLLQQNTFTIALPGGVNDLAGASVTSIRPVDRVGGFLVNVFCRYIHDGHISSFHFNESTQICRMVEQMTLTGEHHKTASWRDTYYRAEEGNAVEHDVVTMRVTLMHLGSKPKGPLFVDQAALDSLTGGSYMSLLMNDRFVVMVALDRTYVFSFAAEAKTADSIESGLEDEQQEKVVLWKVEGGRI